MCITDYVMNHGKNTKSVCCSQCILRQSSILAIMHFLYNFTITVLQWVLPVSSFFSKKMRLFVNGRRKVFEQLERQLDKDKLVIWFHAASLGEYEQGLPVMEGVQKQYPNCQLLITFFSPSGYEVKKKDAFLSGPRTGAKIIAYLPLDTAANARRFLDIARPVMSFFVKYEFWPNYLNELKKRKHRTFLLSGIFREQQAFFKSYGKWMVSSLNAFEYFFLQDESSSKSLSQLGFSNQLVAGDTRFDRVSKQLTINNKLDFVEVFIDNSLCVVCGSTWPEGDTVITSFINDNNRMAKYIIAPHEIRADKIARLKQRLDVKTVLYSEKEGKDLKNYDVLILDTIGLLSKVYNYADVAYVGGALGNTGLHNILEPATFNIPIITGNHIDKFPEAIRLKELAGLFIIKNDSEFNQILSNLLLDSKFRTQAGAITGRFVSSNTGATQSVIEYLEKHS